MNKICIYTAIYGDYENLNNHIKLDNVDYILFTDDINLKSDFWKIIYLPNEENIPSALFYKKIKCLSHIYLKDYDYTIWLDANFSIKNDIFIDYMFDNFKSNKLKLFKHFCLAGLPRNCAYVEGNYSLTIPKYQKEKISDQLTFYKNDNFPQNFGLYQSGFLLRNNHDIDVINFNNLWYNEIIKWGVQTPQCQVSLPYVLWKTNINFDICLTKIWDKNLFNIYEHKR